MSTLETDKLITKQFLENASNDEKRIEDVPEEPQTVSEKLIADEISNENLKSSEDLSEDTESSRDLKSPERNMTDEEEGEEKHSAEPKEEWQDILGSGVLMKKILREGEPESRPTRSDKCLINYTCRLLDADEDDFIEKAENYELGLGEGDVVQGLDVALGLMNKNERCLLKIGSRLAYGDKGLPPKVPGSATVMFDVELTQVQHEQDFDSLSVQERQKMGNKKRERGNWWYQRGENTLAVQCYRRALDYLDEVESESTEHEKPTDKDLQELLEDRLKVLNNMASAQIKMELYDQALTSLQTVLRCQPDNVKALFRKAKIHSAKNDLPLALKLLERAKALEPEDSLIAKEIANINGQINKQKNSEREYARRMFGGPKNDSSGGKSGARTGSKKSSRIQVWVTLGATIFVGLAGALAYKFR